MLTRIRFMPAVVFCSVIACHNASATDKPPLLDLIDPPEDTVRQTLFCPDCLPGPYLIAVHLNGLPVRWIPKTGDVRLDAIDMDLVIQTPAWATASKDGDANRRAAPLAVSHNAFLTFAKTTPGIISRNSIGWPDGFGGTGFLATESFFAGQGARATLSEGDGWCIQPIVEAFSPRVDAKSGTAIGEISIALGTAKPVTCQFPIQVTASSPRTDSSSVASEACRFGQPPGERKATAARITLEGPGLVPTLQVPTGIGGWTCCEFDAFPRCSL